MRTVLPLRIRAAGAHHRHGHPLGGRQGCLRVVDAKSARGELFQPPISQIEHPIKGRVVVVAAGVEHAVQSAMRALPIPCEIPIAVDPILSVAAS